MSTLHEKSAAARSARSSYAAAARPPEKPKKDTGPYAGIWADDIKVDPTCNDFIEGLLTNGGLSVLYGASNSGKTFVALEIAAAVAGNRKFWNYAEVECGVVIYVAAEGGTGIKNRIAAMKLRGLMPTGARLMLVTASPSLLDSADVQRLVDTVEAAATATGLKVRLVIIDTLARVMAGGDENGGQDMGLVVQAAGEIQETTGAHVLFVHHSGKNAAAGARGHSNLRAATDTEIEVSRKENTPIGQVICRKQRDLAFFKQLAFSLDVVELGLNDRKKPITSCVIKYEEPVAPDEELIGERIISFLIDRPEGANATEIVAAFGKTARDALSQLIKECKITLEESGRSKVYRAKVGTFDPLACRAGRDLTPTL